MKYRRVILIAILGLVGLTTRLLTAAPATKPDLSRDALRLLRAECFACHNEEKKKGGLALTSREAALKGGDEGKVVIPGKPEASLLVKALAAGADPHMPPKKQLADAQIKVLRDWIKNGAVWSEAALADEEPVTPLKIGFLPAAYQPVTALALSPDGNGLAFGRGATLLLHDLSLTNLPLVAQQAWNGDAVQAVAWSPDGHQLAAGAFRRLALLDGGSLRLEREWTNGLAGRITAVKFAPDGNRLALADSVAGSGGFVRLLNLTNASSWVSWRAHSDTIFSLDFSRDGTQLATAGGDKLVKIWSVASRQELARLEGHTAQVLAVAFNTNATQVVSGGADKQLKVWDIKTREKISTLGNHSTAVTAVAWPGDGQTIVAVNEGGSVFTYKNLKSHTGEQSSASGDERLAGKAEDTLECLATSADAKLFYAGSQTGVVYVWDGERKLLGRLSPASIHSLVPKSSTVATAQTPLARSKVPLARTNAPVPVKPGLIVGLTAESNRIQLAPEAPFHGVVITAQTTDGFAVDVTGQARFSAKSDAPFRIDSRGGVQAIRPGEGVLVASLGRQRVEIPVKVTGSGTTNETALPVVPTSFVRDVLPALSKAGCNAGPCHAKPEGQNGFKLSVFSYDPKADYSAIVKENRGRRVFPAAPEQSLILQKPSTALPHEGGLRIERGSETWQLLTRWLAEGMPFQQTNEPALQHISVFPKERRYHKGARQQLLVRAHYADGSARDVSRLAAFDSNDKEIAKVDATGEVSIGTLTGQGVVVARYMGFVADAQIMVPADRLLPEAQYAALPRNNFIDDQAYGRLQRLGLFPSDLCTDAEFLRRAKLDAIGLLPTPAEVKAFLADPAPDKRQRFIARVLDDPAYADYWANKWADLLRPNPDRVGVKSVFTLDQWLRDRFGKNEPYDQFVREILLAEGTNHRDGPAVIYRDRREPPELTTMFSQLFLGTRLECAKCHHHPNEKWAQEDFYQFAAFFGPVKQKGAGLSPPISAGTETFYFGKGGAVKHPVTGAVMTPRPLDGPLVVAEDVDPRRVLADWLTSPENPYFARAAVNRVWATFFGRGLVEPVDDFRISNPCVNPELLTSLAEDFTKHGYDLKHLMRRIMESRLYQLSSTPNDTNVGDTRNFSRAYRRRLPAEVLLDAVNDATGVPDTFAAMPIGGRATQAWSYKIDSNFMDAFGRPNASSDCPCERDTQLSVVQSLHLMNSKALQGKLANTTGRARQLADGKLSPAEVVTELYLTTLNRPPTESELKVTTAVFTAPEANRRAATEDVFWALLNSPEFVFNH